MYSIETRVCGPVAEDLAEQVVLAGDLGALVLGVVEHPAVHVAEDVVADPTHHLEVPPGEHGGQDALQAASRPSCRRSLSWRVPRSRASSSIAAGAEPSDGVKLMYEQPRSIAAIA